MRSGCGQWSLNEVIIHLTKNETLAGFCRIWLRHPNNWPFQRTSAGTPGRRSQFAVEARYYYLGSGVLCATDMFRRIRDLSEELKFDGINGLCYVQFIAIFWLHTTLTMHFSKLIFSVLAFATVSVSLNVEVARPASASGSCDDWCPQACFDDYGTFAYHCIIGYGLFIA